MSTRPPTSRLNGSTRWRRSASRHDDAGASLILALLLLLVGVVIVGSIAFETTNELHDSTQFAQVRSLEYSARSVANLAIQSIRYDPLITAGSAPDTLNASPPVPCWSSSSGVSEVADVDGETMAAWCSTLWNPTSSHTRTVTVSACAPSVAAAQCALDPYLQAVVTFDDYPPGVSPPTSNPCQAPPIGDCGSTMQVDSWLWSPTVPTVTAMTPTTGGAAGGTVVHLTGTSFTPGSSVTFISASGNVVVAATSVTVNSATSITATAPPVIQGSVYDVVVTTGGGTSPVTSAATFTYVLGTPTITSVGPATSLSSAGGSRLAVTGSGFTSNAKVTFVPEAGGTSYTSSYVTVSSPSSLTAVTPAVTSIGSFEVVVTTSAGSTPESTSDAVTYVYVVPTVLSIAPTSGPAAGGTTVTITGTGFLSGATVTFYKVASGCQSAGGATASAVTVVNATTITAKSPAVGQDAEYYVDVTTSGGGSTYSANCYPVFTYSG